MKVTCDIGKGHNNDERFSIRVYSGGEISLPEPALIPFFLYLAWLVSFRYFGHGVYTCLGYWLPITRNADI
jgi:hypothetical protein